jgi:ribosomal peptide maturation radical SAM protein 1
MVEASRGGRAMLVSMPLSSPHYPNLALGLLKPLAEQAGAACGVRYFSLDYLDTMGLDAYAALTDPSIYMAQAGEWVFAALADPRLDPDDTVFFTDVLLRHHADAYRPALLMALMTARQGAADFIEHCLNSVDWERYALVGFTTSFQQTMASLALARGIKARHPSITIVFGGANCQDAMGLELLAQYPCVDAVCLGEGEHAFVEIIRRTQAGAPLDGIPGIALRGQSASAPAARTDVEALPYPDFDAFFAQHAASPAAAAFPPAVVFETARGCWWGAKHHCTFCGLNGTSMAFRSKSQDRAYEELAYLVTRHGVSDVANADNILDMDYFKEFLPRLAASPLNLLIYYETKANLRPEHFDTLTRAGVRKIQAGIETLDTALLKLMRKGSTALQNVQTLKLAAEAGIYVEWLALCGFPGETAAEYGRIAALLPALRHLQPPAAFLRARADRFSPYFDDPAGFGVTLEPLPAYRHIYGGDAAARMRLGYHFAMRSPALDDIAGYTADTAREYGHWRDHHATSALWLDGATVHDRRWGWPIADEALTPAAAAILGVAWRIMPWRQMARELGEQHSGLDQAASELERRGWLLREGGQVLALPLRQPGFRAAPSIAEIREAIGQPLAVAAE